MIGPSPRPTLRPRRGLRTLPALGAALAAVAAGCSGDRAPAAAGSPERMNVVLVTLDTTRADHLSLYGYFRDTTPHLEALGRESLVFERLIVPMATTLPTHLSLLTGTHPLEHGVLANITQGGDRFVPSPRLRSFAELSREAGYATAAFISATPLKRGSGAESGFETFDEPEGRSRRGDATTDAALAWLDAQRTRPFLLWIHLFDPHFPFEPPEGYAGRYHADEGLERYIRERRIAERAVRPLSGSIEVSREVINRYDEEILFTDRQLGRIVDALRGRADWKHTTLLVMGDHGEGLCQHGLTGHGDTWDEQLHAPLVMRVPGVSPRRVEVALSAADVLPTLASLARLPPADALRGQASGRDVLDPSWQEQPILSQDTGRERGEGAPYRYALRSGRWKLFRSHAPGGGVRDALFDLREDPFELTDVREANLARARELGRRLERELELRRERGRALRGEGAPSLRPEDPAIVDELEALGYVEGPSGRRGAAREGTRR